MSKLLELYVVFLKIGGLTFGGGMAALPMLKRELSKRNTGLTKRNCSIYMPSVSVPPESSR